MKYFIFLSYIFLVFSSAASDKKSNKIKYDTVAAADSQGMREPLNHSNSPGFFVTSTAEPAPDYMHINLRDSRFPSVDNRVLGQINSLKPEDRTVVMNQAEHTLPIQNRLPFAYAAARHALVHEETRTKSTDDDEGTPIYSFALKKLDSQELEHAKQLQALVNVAVQKNEAAIAQEKLEHKESRESIAASAPPKGCCIVS